METEKTATEPLAPAVCSAAFAWLQEFAGDYGSPKIASDAVAEWHRSIEREKALEKALCFAILNTRRVRERCVEYDPAGSEYEVDWLDEVTQWAALAGLDLSRYDPCAFSH